MRTLMALMVTLAGTSAFADGHGVERFSADGGTRTYHSPGVGIYGLTGGIDDMRGSLKDDAGKCVRDCVAGGIEDMKGSVKDDADVVHRPRDGRDLDPAVAGGDLASSPRTPREV